MNEHAERASRSSEDGVADVVVIGGGIAGLTAAHELVQQGASVELLESNERVGGWIHSERIDGAVVEWGPQSVVASHPEFYSLLCELELDGEILTAPSTLTARFIHSNGRTHRIVPKPLSVLFSSALSLRGKLRALGEGLVKSKGAEGESLSDFTRRRFGPELEARMLSAVTLGIYAATPDQLEAASAMPSLVEYEVRHGSVQRGLRRTPKLERDPAAPKGPFTIAGGLERVPGRLAELLGDRVRTGTRVERVRLHDEHVDIDVGVHDGETLRARNVVIATPPHIAASLLEDQPAAHRELDAIRYSSVALVMCRLDPATLANPSSLEGFGVLAAPESNVPILGAVFGSSLFRERSSDGQPTVAVFVGGTPHPEVGELSDVERNERVVAGLRTVLESPNLEIEPFAQRFHPRAIPLPSPGHRARVARIRESLQGTPITLAGNYLDGVSLHAAIRSGRDAAQQIAERRGS